MFKLTQVVCVSLIIDLLMKCNGESGSREGRLTPFIGKDPLSPFIFAPNIYIQYIWHSFWQDHLLQFVIIFTSMPLLWRYLHPTFIFIYLTHQLWQDISVPCRTNIKKKSQWLIEMATQILLVHVLTSHGEFYIYLHYSSATNKFASNLIFSLLPWYITRSQSKNFELHKERWGKKSIFLS